MAYSDALKDVAKRIVPAPLRHLLRWIAGYRLRGLSSAQYWTRHNVTEHRAFASTAESLDYFDWRNIQYPGYIDLMPVNDGTGKVVLDYGCGPGNDLVGFVTQSKPARLIGADVSPSSLAEAKARLSVHGAHAVELVQLDPADSALPFATASIDLIHSAGVLHHLPHITDTLLEFRRLIRDDGYAQIMVYNYDSIWMHLYAGYLYRKRVPWHAKLPKQELFKATTDGEHCPIVNSFAPAEFCAIADRAGFRTEFRGAAVSLNEMSWLPQRLEALKDPALDRDSRNFLAGLTFDVRQTPLHRGQAAGINGCFRLTPKP